MDPRFFWLSAACLGCPLLHASSGQASTPQSWNPSDIRSWSGTETHAGPMVSQTLIVGEWQMQRYPGTCETCICSGLDSICNIHHELGDFMWSFIPSSTAVPAYSNPRTSLIRQFTPRRWTRSTELQLVIEP
ncbi:hypothetical protein V8C26DRAFT_335778 [Trichoderma gracile]